MTSSKYHLCRRAYYEHLLSTSKLISEKTREFMEECVALDYYTVFQTEEELREKGIDHIPSKSHNKQLLGFWVPHVDEGCVKFFCTNLIGPLRMNDD